LVEVTGKPFPSKSWTIEDHCLKSIPRKDGFQDIRTVDSFPQLRAGVDWKMLAKGNSGVKYLIQKVDEWVNKEGRQARAAALNINSPMTPMRTPRSRPRSGRLALLGLRARSQDPAADRRVQSFAPRRRWRARGTLAQRHARGALRTERPEVQKLFPASRRRKSAISLQNHSSEVWFRNIKIRAR